MDGLPRLWPAGPCPAGTGPRGAGCWLGAGFSASSPWRPTQPTRASGKCPSSVPAFLRPPSFPPGSGALFSPRCRFGIRRFHSPIFKQKRLLARLSTLGLPPDAASLGRQPSGSGWPPPRQCPSIHPGPCGAPPGGCSLARTGKLSKTERRAGPERQAGAAHHSAEIEFLGNNAEDRTWYFIVF